MEGENRDSQQFSSESGVDTCLLKDYRLKVGVLLKINVKIIYFIINYQWILEFSAKKILDG